MIEKSDYRIVKIVIDFNNHSIEVITEYDLIENGEVLSTIRDSGYIRRKLDKQLFENDLKSLFPNIENIDILDLIAVQTKKVYPDMKNKVRFGQASFSNILSSLNSRSEIVIEETKNTKGFMKGDTE